MALYEAWLIEAAIDDAIHDLGEALRRRGAVHQPIARDDHLLSADGHKRDGLRLARLETHRGAGGHVEPLAEGGGAIEHQARVGLDEVVVRAHLDRAVAGVDDAQLDELAPRVERDEALGGESGSRHVVVLLEHA
eukprot:scaffold119369_cov60-Phaeocystis_antarctica.AAC.1